MGKLTGELLVGVELLVFITWAYGRYRVSRGVHVVFALWWVALLDTVFYADTDASFLNGFFHPSLFHQNVRLVQLLIPVAFAAHLMWNGWPRRWAVSATWWWAFSLWTIYGIFSGVMQHHSGAFVFRQASILIYLIMMIGLTASVPIADYLDEKRFTRFITSTAIVGGTMLALTEAGFSHTSNAIPGLPLFQFGQLGPDAASLFPAIGVIGFVVELSRQRRRRPWFLVACVALILTHLVSSQRAERLDLYLTILLVLAACAYRARRRLRVSRFAVGATVVAALTVVVVIPMFYAGVDSALTGRPAAVNVPFAQQTITALTPTHRQGSVQSRYNQWGVVEGLIKEHPWIGSGLGRTFVHYEQGSRSNVTQDITHDIALDLLFRNGIVGLVMFLGAIGLVLNAGVLVWRRHPRPEVAAFAMAASAALVGLLARGTVESIFEKYRLAVGLGILIGLVLSARTSLPADEAVFVEPSDSTPELIDEPVGATR